MRKIISIIICTVVFIGCIPIGALAFAGEISTYNNATLQTNTFFTINNSGIATVTTDYTGYKSITRGATINIKIQKRFLFIFWSDVVSWTDEATGYYYSNTHSTAVDKGDYRALVEYTIYDVDGSSDIITENLERSY